MQSKIVELDLNEIETVTGGATYATYATMSPSTTLQSSYTAPTYVRPTYTAPTLSSTSLSMYPAPTLR